MADFSKPVPGDLAADVLTNIRNIVDSLAKMQDGTSDTNIASGYLRYSSTNKRFEKYNGSVWGAVELSNLAANAVATASIAADAVTDPKIRLTNTGWLRARNAANNADLNVLRATSGDNTEINAPAARTVGLCINGTPRWYVNDAASPELYPAGNDTHNLGQSLARVANAYIRYLQQVEQINISAANLEIGPTSSHELKLKTANTIRWKVSSIGVFLPEVDNSYAIGSTTVQASAMYSGLFTSKDAADTWLIAPASRALGLGANGALRWTVDVNGHLDPVASNTYDIGLVGTFVRALYTAAVRGGTGTDLSLIPAASQALGLGSNNGLKWTVDINGHFDPLADASYDLGLTATRIRNAYIGRVDFGVTGSTAYITGNADRLRLGSPVTGSAGSIVEYMTIERSDGTQRKIALYATS